MDLRKELRVFTLSGFTSQKKNNLKAMIKDLGGHVLDDMVFSIKCTHVICQKPCRSEKFLSGLATGKWILTEEYVSHSFRKRKWLSEQPYEWGRQLCAGTDSTSLLRAPKRARLRYGQGSDHAFSRWKAGLLLTDQPRASVYERLLRCGGAKVVTLKAPTSTRLRLPSGLTHVFADQTQHRLVAQLAQAGVPCLLPSYIGDFLTGEEKPCKRHFVYSPESSNCCYAYATATQQKFKKRELSCEYIPEQVARNADRCKRKRVEHRENDPPATGCFVQPRCRDMGLSSVYNSSLASGLSTHEPSADTECDTNRADDCSLPENINRGSSTPSQSTVTTAKSAAVTACSTTDDDKSRTDTDANQVFSCTLRICLEEKRSADVAMLLQSSMRPDSRLPDPSLLTRIMSALQSEEDVVAGKRYYELLQQISTVMPMNAFKAAMEAVGLERVRCLETAMVSGSTHAWCLISFLFSALLDENSKAQPGLRSCRLLLLRFLADLFVNDIKELRGRKPSEMLLYRVMWSNCLYVSVSQGSGAALLASLTKSLVAKDAALTRISLQLVSLLPLLCGGRQSVVLARHIALSIRNGAFYDHHFLTLIFSELHPVCLKNRVCEFLLNLMTGCEGRQLETSAAAAAAATTAMTMQEVVRRYCCIPPRASFCSGTVNKHSLVTTQTAQDISHHQAEIKVVGCESGNKGEEPQPAASVGMVCEKTHVDTELVTCSFGGCCCGKFGQSADLVTRYLLVLYHLVVTCTEMSSDVLHSTSLSDRESASRLILFVSEHLRFIEHCVSQRRDGCTINADALEDLQTIPSMLRALLHSPQFRRPAFVTDACHSQPS